ncbi:ABC transporter permease [Tissierella praeacuta]|uniref:ABC transporter permease n=2 Tax=Tissierella praeacuta TaxID=43131 RepID=UPI0028AA2950|nr:ABC transporter permease [Tissierella praeacuta]
MKKTNRIRTNLFSMIILILFLIFWQYSAVKIDNNAILPTVGKVAINFANAFDNFVGIGSIPKNIGYSLVRVFIGYSIGVLIGLPLGLLMGYFKLFRDGFENFINLFKPIPSISWQPLVMGWFGINSLARILNLEYGPLFAVLDNFKISMIFIIVIGSFFPIWGGAMLGVSNVRKVLIESSEVLGGSKSDIFFHVLIPAAGPTIVNGLRSGLTASWACLVAAEMLPGSMNGIGYLMTHSRELARMDLVITGIISIGVVGAALDAIFRIIIKRKFSWEKNVR